MNCDHVAKRDCISDFHFGSMTSALIVALASQSLVLRTPPSRQHASPRMQFDWELLLILEEQVPGRLCPLLTLSFSRTAARI